ncbi:MAG: lytic transglycosylase F, partial [Bacteroidetes bacterium SW_10_40_5]
MTNGFYKISVSPSLGLLLAFLLFIGCSNQNKEESNSGLEEKDPLKDPIINQDLEAVKEDGKLKAITGYSSTSYFIYRGKPMGYEYELLEGFADYLDLELEIIVAEDIQKMFEMLNQGEGELIAYGLTVTQSRKKQVDFSAPLNKVRQKLVQKKPDKWQYMRRHELEKHLITDPSDLEGDTVYVRTNSSYAERMQNLNEEIGGGITVIEAPEEQGTEALIERVA